MALYYIEWIDYVSLIVILFIIIYDFFFNKLLKYQVERERGGDLKDP